jgi:cytochrome P450
VPEVADFDHHDPAFVADPWPTYAALRRTCPVVRSERYGGFWLLIRHEDVKAAAKDWQTFTSSVPNVTAIPSSHDRGAPDLPIEIDPPMHTRYQQLVGPVFARHVVEALRPGVRALAGGLVDRLLAAGGGDLVNELAVPVSVGTLASFMDLRARTGSAGLPGCGGCTTHRTRPPPRPTTRTSTSSWRRGAACSCRCCSTRRSTASA